MSRRSRYGPMQEPVMDRTLVIPGAEAAIIGTFRRPGQVAVIAYDYSKLVAHYCKLGMSDLDAREYIASTLEGNWRGTGTPAIVHTEMEDDDDAK